MREEMGKQESDPEKAAEEWADSFGCYQGRAMGDGGKRLGMEWTPWMGDWFTSYSPRNSNSHGEGFWDHWINLALSVLSDPLTEIVRPEVYDAALKDKILNLYDGANRSLTYLELRERFDQSFQKGESA